MTFYHNTCTSVYFLLSVKNFETNSSKFAKLVSDDQDPSLVTNLLSSETCLANLKLCVLS